MCFAFSSWTDSLASAMTTLGAKPNHAFFNCQHPYRKKSARRPSSTPRNGREIRRTRLPGERARSRLASACRKRNVVFKVVLSAGHCARRGCGPSRASLATTQRRQRPKDKRIDPEIFPSRVFFAPHKPDCANLRELQKALCAIHGALRAHRNGVDDMRFDAFTRIEAAIDPRAPCAPRCVEQTIRTAIPERRAGRSSHRADKEKAVHVPGDGFGGRCWRAP